MIVAAGLCECGCGQETAICPSSSAARGYVRGEARRFVHGHNRRAQPVETTEVVLCGCGCGAETPIAKSTNPARGAIRGKPQRFVFGHQNRGRLQSAEVKAKRSRSGADHPNWRGGRSDRGDGRVRIHVGRDHPMADVHGYVFDYRLIAAASLGRTLSSDEHVHHIDGDRRNNDPQNLLIVTMSEHARIHALIRSGHDPKEAALAVMGSQC